MAYYEEFLSNPLMFLRLHAVSPPDGIPGKLIRQWNVKNKGNITEGFIGGNESAISYVDGGPRVKYIRFVAHGLFPGALTLKLEDTITGYDQIPIHWLPWASLKVVKTTIPEIPRNVAEEDENINPRFFFTAGINGCSVFVKGPPTKPTIFHAGITGKLARDAGAFWREQLEAATKGTYLYLEKTMTEVNKREYMDKDSRAIRDYIGWVNRADNNPFTIEVTSNFGCVFGIRFGRYWSFYLQESALIETAKIIKQTEVARKPGNQKTLYERATDFTVKQKTLATPRRFWFDKKTTIFVSTNSRCVCFRVSEIYPNRYWSGELKDLVKTHTM